MYILNTQNRILNFAVWVIESNISRVANIYIYIFGIRV